MIDGNGIPLCLVTAKANVGDVSLALKTIDNLKIGRRRRRPKRVRADKGYDSAALRRGLRERGIKPALDARDFSNRRQPESAWNDSREIRYAPCRWKVEQRFACLDQARRLNFLFEHTRTRYETFMRIAFIRCYMKRLVRCKKKKLGVLR